MSNPLALTGEVAGILAVLGSIYRVAAVVAKILIELRANSKATAQNTAATSAISGKLDDHMSLVRQTLDDYAKRLQALEAASITAQQGTTPPAIPPPQTPA